MSAPLRPRLKMPWLMLGCAGGLALALAGEQAYLAAAAPLQSPPPPAAPAAATDLPRYVPPPLGRFAEIAERPLFVPDRRPQRPPDAAPAGPPPLLTVQGVVLTNDRQYAVIQHGNPSKLESVAEGATVEGWVVETIDRDHIALASGTRRVEVPVGKPAASTPRPPPVVAPFARRAREKE
jgi:hypothetical protein